MKIERFNAPGNLTDEDRGLLFMAHQASLRDQFEFVTKTWVNLANSPHDSIPPTGHDPLIGNSHERCFVRLPLDDNRIDLPEEPSVVMSGGGYFSTPSISALFGGIGRMSAREDRVAPVSRPAGPGNREP